MIVWVVAVALAAAPSAESKAALSAALADFKTSCGASPAMDIDYKALAGTYESRSWLRDDDTAMVRCADAVSAIASSCGATRRVVWSSLDRRAVETDQTRDLSPVAALKTIRCTTPTFLPTLKALVTQHPEWPADDRWTNAAKLHWADDFMFLKIAPELTLSEDGSTATVGLFAGTVNPGDIQVKLDIELLNREYKKVLNGGPIGTTGRFAVLQAWMNKELKRFNKECGAEAKVEIDWKDLEQAWPGWTTWADKGRDYVLEDVAAHTFVELVISDLADLCAKDGDGVYTALKNVKTLRLAPDPRGRKIVEAWKKKPKKDWGDIKNELFPDAGTITPAFEWTGSTISYRVFFDIANPSGASSWMETEIGKH